MDFSTIYICNVYMCMCMCMYIYYMNDANSFIRYLLRVINYYYSLVLDYWRNVHLHGCISEAWEHEEVQDTARDERPAGTEAIEAGTGA